MTQSIDINHLADPVRRNRWGQYLIVPPEGGKPQGYVRVTTVAKALDDGGGLADWKAAMCAGGMIMRPGLRARWEALVAEYGNPWYAGTTAKAACKELVAECASVGGANDRRDTGSSLHTITALADTGRPVPHLAGDTRRDLDAYLQGRRKAGIDILPGAVETTVVLDTHGVAGTFDRLVTHPHWDLPRVADLKFGRDLSYAWQPIAVQLAAYAHAEHIYRYGPDKNGRDDTRTPMPPVDQEHGIVFWVDAGSGQLEIFDIYLKPGWEAFGHSLWARTWRQTSPAAPYEPDSLIPALEASLAQTGGAAGKVTAEGKLPADPAAVRAWLQQRIDTIGAHPAGRADLAGRWPAGMPTLKTSTGHTPEQLEVVEQVLDTVERRHELTFPDPKPGGPAARIVDQFPGSTVTPRSEP